MLIAAGIAKYFLRAHAEISGSKILEAAFCEWPLR
jgi:hypothetical protein